MVGFLPFQSDLGILRHLLTTTSFAGGGGEQNNSRHDFSSVESFWKVLLCRHADNTDRNPLVDKVMTSVKGGSLLSAVTMRAKLNKEGVMDIQTYQDWASSIADAPALINSEVGTPETWQASMFLF